MMRKGKNTSLLKGVKYVFSAGIFLCVACSETENLYSDKKIPLQIQVGLQQEVRDFNTKSMPDIIVPEPEVETIDDPESPISEGFIKKLSYIVYETKDGGETTEFIKQKNIEKKDTDELEIIYDTLYGGRNYHICIIGYNDVITSLEKEKHELSFEKLGDTFFFSDDFYLGEKAMESWDVVLKRIVGKIEFVNNAKIALDLDSVEITSTPYYNKIDLITGKSIATPNKQTVVNHKFTEGEKQEDIHPYEYYTFIPPEGSTFKFDILTKSVAGDTLQYFELGSKNVFMNKILSCVGPLYSYKNEENTFNIILDNEGEWGGSSTEDLTPIY